MTATIKMAPPKAAALCAACDADAIIPPPLPHSAVPAVVLSAAGLSITTCCQMRNNTEKQ
jgi:hypothetical protein